jgi:hypothetical protein
VSTVGYIRFPAVVANTTYIGWRIGAFDKSIISSDGSNQLTFGTTSGNSVISGNSQIALGTATGTMTWSGSVLQFGSATSINTQTQGTAIQLTVASGSSFTSGNSGAALALRGGAPGGGAGLKGKCQITLGSSDILAEVAEVIQGNRVLALVRGTTITSTQMPANSGDLVIYIANASTTPTASSVGGGILYCTGGALRFRGSAGTDTPIAPA